VFESKMQYFVVNSVHGSVSCSNNAI